MYVSITRHKAPAE